MRKLLIPLVASCLLVASSPLLAWKAPPPPEGSPDELKKFVTDIDALYAAREKPGNNAKVLQELRDAMKRWPDSADVLWRASRALCWEAEGTTDSARHKALAVEAWDAGKRAVKAAPKMPEAYYFNSLAVGEYSRSVGILTALKDGLESKFRDPILAAQKVDDTIDDGGIYAALGRYKYELPWPLRDYDQSIAYLRKGLKVNPNNLRVKVYLAESLAARDDGGDRAEAQRLLKEVLAATPGKYDTADEMRAQGWARAAMKKLGFGNP